MSYKKQCDRCGESEKWTILSDGMFEVTFARNLLQESTGFRPSIHLCTECFNKFRDWMNKLIKS